MIIIKYNFLASYTKKLHLYFNNFIFQNNINYNLKYTHKMFKEQRKDNLILDFKNKRIYEFIEKNNFDNSKNFFIESLEDSTIFGNDKLQTFLSLSKNMPVVFLVIPDYYNRLKSLIFRNKIIVNSKTEIDDILIQNFKKHCDFSF